MRILIAEDDVISRRMLETTLAAWRHEIVVCQDGDEASNALRQDDAPRLAILDWMMPGKDGVQICREIRSRDCEHYVYILLLTAKGQKADIVEGLEAGADDYITKPFEKAELRARIDVGRRMLELHTALAQRIEELQNAMAHIKTLQGVLPICMYCHRIRREPEVWDRLEKYISEHSDAKLTHGICPDCMEEHHPETPPESSRHSRAQDGKVAPSKEPRAEIGCGPARKESLAREPEPRDLE